MKVAFHFDSAISDEIINYGLYYYEFFFKIYIDSPKKVNSKVYSGDLLLAYHSYEWSEESSSEKEGYTRIGSTGVFSKSKYESLFERWLESGMDGWFKMSPDQIERLWGKDIYVICLETIGNEEANFIDQKLRNIDGYLGAFELNDTSQIQWVLYSQCLISRYRINGVDLFLFWDGVSEDSKDFGLLEHWKEFGFGKVEFESLEMQQSIFDACDTFEHAQYMARWRKEAAALLSSVVDSITHLLGDAAPDIGKKLCAATDAYYRATTTEDYAHVALSCRRIIEYVADTVFPPIANGGDGPHKLGKIHFKNRLLAFAEQERKSNSSIDLISSSMDMLNDQLEKISELQNKGLHDEIVQSEARRCLIRTLLIIDDILSLRKDPLPVKVKYKIPWADQD